MVLQHINPDTIGIKTGATTATIKTGGIIKVEDRQIEGPGEYDIAGVGIHAYSGYAVIFTEGIRIAVVWDANARMNQEDDTNLDIIIFLIEDTKQIDSSIKEQDPRIVVFRNETVAQQIQKQDSIALKREANYKLTAQSLPAEEREYLLLT